ncbi:MAG TPA: UDP-N-acetylmuramoyl-tripeptide--D-alanyl-D-alanine ligase [Flavobacteriales bacterium]|nr:UDP-N-acetylmuramoyl-tripeptide--D-alanyl-D-alanine ligase [Flavobacteriales bacterium]
MEIQELHKIYSKHSVVSTDTRNIAPNSLFFALRGENFDGNEFAAEALKQGSIFAIVDEPSVAEDDKCILVDDVLKTLQDLATYHLQQKNVQVIAITGTNGKTTTKELLNAVLSKKFNVHATKGNLNNHIGVPLTILSMKSAAELLVVELGANHIGEIEKLCVIAQPSFGLITNIGKAHLEGFGSLEGVVKAKKELYQYIADHKGTLFVNGSDDRLLDLSKGARRILYGSADSNDCVCKVEECNPFVVVKWVRRENKVDKQYEVASKIFGEYNFDNIAAAICIGNSFGIAPQDITTAIEDYLPANNRSQILETDFNRIVLDAYNANPMNMKAALESFHQMESDNKVLIIGDMLELGSYTQEEHLAILEQVRKQQFDNVFLVGENFGRIKDSISCTHFNTVQQAKDYLVETPVRNSLILLKASRGIGLESLVEAL